MYFQANIEFENVSFSVEERRSIFGSSRGCKTILKVSIVLGVL